MEIDRLAEILNDERCGLFFLAGLDGRDMPDGATLTIHASEGALTPAQRSFIEATAAAFDARLGVEFRYHSSADLHSPDTLESFARLFQHHLIVADPTGAFSRVPKLLQLAGTIRAQMGKAAGQILWEAYGSRLVVVPNARQAIAPDVVERRVRAIIDGLEFADLKKALRSITVGSAVPGRRYTPIDAASRVVRRKSPGLTSLLARASGIVAMFGFGTLANAHAGLPADDVSEPPMMPGITTLTDLTTLGENSYGIRNRYQAIGGLRLYFGETGTVKVSVFNVAAADLSCGKIQDASCAPLSDSKYGG